METFSKKMSEIPIEKLLNMAEVHFKALPLLTGVYNRPPKIDDLDCVFGEVCRRLEQLQAENTRLRAAVTEMERMLPVLEYVEKSMGTFFEVNTRGGTLAALEQAIENAKQK
jgi:hypothetical protein